MKLNRKGMKIIKANAFWLKKVVEYNECIEYAVSINRQEDIGEFIELRRKAAQRVARLSLEFQRYFNISNRKFDKLIFELVCNQFIRSNENPDGPLHPEFHDNWAETLYGYRFNFIPTREIRLA